MSIGTHIIQARNLRNISQRELSERSGIASSYLSRIENRRLEPRPKTLRRIAEALGVPLSELFREGRGGQAVSRCAITVSGNCIMELLRSRRRQGQRPEIEAFSPRQLQQKRYFVFPPFFSRERSMQTEQRDDRVLSRCLTFGLLIYP